LNRNASLLILASMLLVSAKIAAQPLGNSSPVVSIGDVGTWSSLALVGDNPVISFHDRDADQLKLLVCFDPGCVSAAVRLLAERGVTSRAIVRADQRPLIAYRSNANFMLQVYSCDNPQCSRGRSQSLSSAGTNVSSPDIVIGADGNPIVSYFDRATEDLKLWRCSDPDCVAGTIETLDESGNVGRNSRIVLREDSRPLLIYRDITNETLKVYNCDDDHCGSGSAQTLVTTGLTRGADVALRINGHPIISYVDNSAGPNQLKVFECDDENCSGGIERTLAEDRSVLDTTIGVRGFGRPLIVYSLLFDGLAQIDCFSFDCASTRAPQALDDLRSVNQPDLAFVPSTGRTVVSYYDLTNDDLRLFRLGGLFGSGFEAER